MRFPDDEDDFPYEMCAFGCEIPATHFYPRPMCTDCWRLWAE